MKRKKLVSIGICFGILLIFGISKYTSATPIYGSITVSVVLVDNEQNITNGAGGEGVFLIGLNSADGFEQVLEFKTPLALNHSLFGTVYDSQSITIVNLPIYDLYYYDEMTVESGDWEILGYNDQLKTDVNSLDDFYPINDKNLDSNHIINLALSKGKDRELGILLGSTSSNKSESLPSTPEPGTLLMIGAGVSVTIAGSQIKRRISREKIQGSRDRKISYRISQKDTEK